MRLCFPNYTAYAVKLKKYIQLSKEISPCCFCIIIIQGIYPGAKVQRSTHWNWEDQDGGPGKTGKILKVQDWDKNSIRSVASIHWAATNLTNVYRIGHRGKIDIQYIQPASNGNIVTICEYFVSLSFFSFVGQCYIEHLPILGKAQPVSVGNIERSPEASHIRHAFNINDKVKIVVNEEQLEQLQDGNF